jgi:predicted dehydrogenase
VGELGAAVIGTGFGGRVHVPALRAAGFKVLAMVGRDAERTARRAERLGIARGSTSVDEVLGDDDVVAVTIATPPSTHRPLAIAAARAGKHVVCEKPFALTAPEAMRMFQSVEDAGVVHLVGHEFRWSTDRATAGRAIAEGRIGEPRLATFVGASPLVADPEMVMPPWWFDETAGGGWLGASGSHAVDQIRAWLGEFASVSADLVIVSQRAGVADDTFSARFRLRSGVVGVLQQTGGAWGARADMTRVTGSSGTLRLQRGSVVIADRDGEHELPVPEDLVLPILPESDDPRHRFTHLELGPYTRLCEALRTGIETGSPASAVPVPTFADGVAGMRVLDAIRESARHGGEVVHLTHQALP